VQLSIITICYNEVINIKRTLQSVVNQTWQNFEWIVIDGGMTDGNFYSDKNLWLKEIP